ncbi:protein of unknown function [Streptomyces murinus]
MRRPDRPRPRAVAHGHRHPSAGPGPGRSPRHRPPHPADPRPEPPGPGARQLERHAPGDPGHAPARAVRGAGGADSGRRSGRVRGCGAVVPRGERAGEPVGAGAGRAGCRAGAVRRRGAAALRRAGRGVACGAEDGAAYVPIDPDYPADRIAYILADADPMCVITGFGAQADLPKDSTQVLLDEPEMAARLGAMSDENVADPDRLASLGADAPAYVIYTSGSTGRPKGVVVEHRSVVDYVRWAVETYPGVRGTRCCIRLCRSI